MFPAITEHYKDLLYGAYKSENAAEYLNEFLKPYESTLVKQQVKYLIKCIMNRDRLKRSDLMKTIRDEENDLLGAQILSRFIYYATSMCHIWYINDKDQIAYRYCLDPLESTIICYYEPNEAISYMWLDVDIRNGCVRLIKSNITHMTDYGLKTLWQWSFEGDREVITKNFTFDMLTGNVYKELASNPQSEYPVMRIAVTDNDNRVGITQELGLKNEWPFISVITYTNSSSSFILSKVLFNSRNGTLCPILVSMHPQTDLPT